jgi:hypothetical protein
MENVFFQTGVPQVILTSTTTEHGAARRTERSTTNHRVQSVTGVSFRRTACVVRMTGTSHVPVVVGFVTVIMQALTPEVYLVAILHLLHSIQP